jgi:hypothetical protein
MVTADHPNTNLNPKITNNLVNKPSNDGRPDTAPKFDIKGRK